MTKSAKYNGTLKGRMGMGRRTLYAAGSIRESWGSHGQQETREKGSEGQLGHADPQAFLYQSNLKKLKFLKV